MTPDSYCLAYGNVDLHVRLPLPLRSPLACSLLLLQNLTLTITHHQVNIVFCLRGILRGSLKEWKKLGRRGAWKNMKHSHLLLLYRRKYISRSRFFLLVRPLRSRKQHVQRNAPDSDWKGTMFCLENLTEKECLAHFRFEKGNNSTLHEVLQIQLVIRTISRDVAEGTGAICILLKRFSYADRWNDLPRMFGRREGTLSHIFYHVLRLIDRKISHVLQEMKSLGSLKKTIFICRGYRSERRVIPGCFGFVNGIARPIARPECPAPVF